MKFKKGQAVIRYLTGAGVTTKEDAVVSKVTKAGVWLDNGSGNDPSGPFDPITGRSEPGAFGFSSRIEPKP